MDGQAASAGPGGEVTRSAITVADGSGDAHEVAATPPRARRWVVVTLSILLVIAIAGGSAALVLRSRQTERFCTTEAIIDPTGRHTYHRDPDRDCRWVDENGVPMGER